MIRTDMTAGVPAANEEKFSLAVACHDVRVGEVEPGEDLAVTGGRPIGTLIELVARGARLSTRGFWQGYKLGKGRFFAT